MPHWSRSRTDAKPEGPVAAWLRVYFMPVLGTVSTVLFIILVLLTAVRKAQELGVLPALAALRGG